MHTSHQCRTTSAAPRQPHHVSANHAGTSRQRTTQSVHVATRSLSYNNFGDNAKTILKEVTSAKAGFELQLD